jgi:hypothetical protein
MSLVVAEGSLLSVTLGEVFTFGVELVLLVLI